MASTDAKKDATAANVIAALKHLSCKKHVHVANMIYKCLQETQNIERNAQNLFQFAECLVVKSWIAVISVLEAVIRVPVHLARLMSIKLVPA